MAMLPEQESQGEVGLLGERVQVQSSPEIRRAYLAAVLSLDPVADAAALVERRAQRQQQRLSFSARADLSLSPRPDPTRSLALQPPVTAAPMPPSIARLLEWGSAQLAGKLRAQTNKSAEAWVQFAVIEDELSGDPRRFSDNLIEATIATGGDGGPLELLAALCQRGATDQDAGHLLVDLIQVTSSPAGRGPVEAHVYWDFTGPLWLHLLKTAPFPTFARTLERCRSGAGADEARDRLMLDVLLLRNASGRADLDWLDSEQSRLQARLTADASGLRDELTQCIWLQRYLHQREAFVENKQPTAHIDKALIAILRGEAAAADHEVRSCMLEITARRRQHLNALQPGQTLDDSVIAPLHDWVTKSTSRCKRPPSTDAAAAQARVTDLLARIERVTDRTVLGRVWSMFALSMLVLGALALVLPWLAADVWSGASGPRRFVLPALISALLTGCYLRGWPSKAMGQIWNPIARYFYSNTWRELIVEFLSAYPMPLEELMEHCSTIDDKEITNQYHLVAALDGDSGVELFALACCYLEAQVSVDQRRSGQP